MNLRFSTIWDEARALARRTALVLPAAVLASALVAAPALAAEGDPSITYDGAHNELTVEGGYDSATSTDLFASFKGLVPGDSVTQTVDLAFTDISAGTRLYIKADISGLSDAAVAALSQMELAVSLAGEGDFEKVEPAAPNAVFAGEDAVHVATINEPATCTMTLTLSIPTSVGNELAELGEVRVPWIITIEEDDGEDGDLASTVLTPHAIDLVAYEGGVGTNAADGSVGDALPDPEWTNVDWSDARITVDNQVWDEDNPYWSQGTEGLPFRWAYGTVAEDPSIVTTSARAGYYYLLAAPLEADDGSEPVVTVNGRLLDLPDDYVVTMEDGSDVMLSVRDVTDDEAADALADSTFKAVYGGDGASAVSALSDALGGLLPARAYAADGALSGALDGEFTSTGTHAGDCDNTVAHAHVADGTTFTKNGRSDLPVNDDARIGLLWDDFVAGVLGEPEREGVLDGKARAEVGGDFATSDEVQRRFKYIDLVDMNDGNLWVATADQSEVTIFVPYFEGIDADDQIALVYFDGLTRDYTFDMASADLDSEIAGTNAHRLTVTKADDGILFNVPWSEFGPFELLWIDGDAGDDTGEEPGDDTGEEPGDDTGDKVPADDDFTEDETGKTHDEALAQTGDNTLLIVGGVTLVALVALLTGLLLRRRENS